MILILSGEIAVGKSTLAQQLAAHLGAWIFKTREYIRGNQPSATTRAQMQAAGEALDRETSGEWIAAAVQMRNAPDTIIDAVRIAEHVEWLRERNPQQRVLHVHLEADDATLAARYARRGETTTYAEAKANATEAHVGSLRKLADLVVDTSRCEQEDVLLRVLALVLPPAALFAPTVDVLVGGQYGSEGKGHVVSHLAPDYNLLVRVGGPNAGHTVITPDAQHKVSFYHLPSGILHAPNADVVLGPGSVINPTVLEKEFAYTRDLRGRLFIDPQANVITDEDIAAENALVKNIGSTGQGVGIATARKIVDRAAEGRRLARDCEALKPYLRPTLDVLEEHYQLGSAIMLEGTQGTGLSLHHGHYPYVTSRDTAAASTAGEAGIAPRRIRKSIIVMRTNPIRVQSPADGTSGPMGRELTWEEVSTRAGVPADELRKKEMTTTTKRQRRVAEFCWRDLRRAVLLNGPTDIALTFVDYIAHSNRAARRFEQLSEETHQFIQEIERVASCPVSLITTRFHQRSIIDRRHW